MSSHGQTPVQPRHSQSQQFTPFEPHPDITQGVVLYLTLKQPVTALTCTHRPHTWCLLCIYPGAAGSAPAPAGPVTNNNNGGSGQSFTNNNNGGSGQSFTNNNNGSPGQTYTNNNSGGSGTPIVNNNSGGTISNSGGTVSNGGPP